MLVLFRQPDPDPILTLGGLFRADGRPDKLDLGIGVYRDESGETPIMRSVRAAEERLIATQKSKSSIAGLPLARIPDFVNAILAIQRQRDWGKSMGCGGSAGRR
jgi:aspartate/tyrosine/aromatic aminotransferase